MANLTPAAILTFWLAADDPGVTRQLRKGESVAGIKAKAEYQRADWEQYARKILGA